MNKKLTYYVITNTIKLAGVECYKCYHCELKTSIGYNNLYHGIS